MVDDKVRTSDSSLSTNVDGRDHPFILGTTNADLRPLVVVMQEAEAQGKHGSELQAVEDAWLGAANLRLFPDVLADALSQQGVATPAKLADFR